MQMESAAMDSRETVLQIGDSRNSVRIESGLTAGRSIKTSVALHRRS